MTSVSAPRRKDLVAADEFEARIERTFVKSETVFTLDGEIVMRLENGSIQTSDEI
ncbi:hypothetical protein [Rhodoplanes sp. Z2-YC6860]|uniref:hypothetical protein n=1 Tax=Rhodoplanes sp. Z2-YC6860 TaxID=674703 RepID=UPI0012EDC834|nr:hypothetical protein [Rhodoplanes sp. Z2-YC6860]